jgi:hypothetical protein
MKKFTEIFGTVLSIIVIFTLAWFLLAQPLRASDVTMLLDIESEEGETKDAFAARVGVVLTGFTYSTGHEACGVIAEQAGRYSVVLTTEHSPVRCTSIRYLSGWTPTDETIHSHPFSDMNGRIEGIEQRARRHSFSKYDYAAGPGYLVDNGKLFHQRGRGTKRFVSDIDNLVAGDIQN